MSQVETLVKVLKRALKENGVTYAALARSLQMSEANVKRMFSTASLSITRVEAICQVVGLELTDLLRLLDEERHRISRLTETQEQELVSDIRLLLVAVCARNNWSMAEIVQHYHLPESECIRLLIRLDRLKLIELRPDNQIKLMVAKDFRWIPGGPIERYFEERIRNDFLGSGFSKDRELRRFLTGALSPGSHDTLLRKLHAVARDFADMHNEDARLPLSEKISVSMVLATRPWELSEFAEIRRVQHRDVDD